MSTALLERPATNNAGLTCCTNHALASQIIDELTEQQIMQVRNAPSDIHGFLVLFGTQDPKYKAVPVSWVVEAIRSC